MGKSLIEIRSERAEDAPQIAAVTTAAFAGEPHSSGTEAAIVAGLRVAGALTVSLVAEDAGELLGHVAFSPVTIDGRSAGWFGLGPVSVRPDRQSVGVGRALIEAGLAELRAQGAKGCVVLGDPAYYGRFGFSCDPTLRYADAPAEYFQRLSFGAETPTGKVDYHPAFGAA